MNNLLIILTQSAAILEILALLLGAAIIGFVTSWLYNKSIYRKKIEVIESDLNDHKKQILVLRTDKDSLQKTLSEKDNEIKHLACESCGSGWSEDEFHPGTCGNCGAPEGVPPVLKFANQENHIEDSEDFVIGVKHIPGILSY